MNDWLQDSINDLAGHSLIADKLMELSATDLIFLAVPFLVLLWFWPVTVKDRALNQRLAVISTLNVLIALAIAMGLSHLINSPRPFTDDPSTRQLIAHSADNGFPSDHATFAFALAAPLFWWHRRLGLVVLSAAILVGVARVYVGVHWPSDVFGAALIGALCGSVAASLVPFLEGPQRLLARFLPPFLIVSAGRQ